MAASDEIYANVEFDCDNNEAADGIEDIYLNNDLIDSQYSGNKTKDLIPKRIPLATCPGTVKSWRKSTRGVAVCLGLLSILLLAGIIGLLVYYNRMINNFKDKNSLFISNSTNEQQQFQTRYNKMAEERDQFQTRYNAITRERDQFQTRYNAMTRERDQFQTRYNAMTEKFSLVDQHLQQGWRFYKPSLYFISTERKTWEDSRRDCVEKNADLLIIKSREKQVYLHGLNNEVFWIGLNEKQQEGKWMWVDGTELTTGYWGGGQPNKRNDIDEDCAARWSSQPTAEKSWHDAPCNELHYWMCEKKVQL